ncbi:hypothetical protein Dimus_012766 [Dionaea muscipula]
MKIKQASAGILTNYEVLELLRSRGASKDPTRVMASLSMSELTVYDYLVETAACNQTKDNINEYLKKVKMYDLAQAEILNVLNLRPRAPPIMDSMIEKCEQRFGEERLLEFVQMVVEVLPAPPKNPKPDEGSDENKAGGEVDDDVKKGKGSSDNNCSTSVEAMEIG